MVHDSSVLPLRALFAGRLFRVPDYQRGYAWTRRQLEDFWRDLEVLRPEGEHFMGMLVVKVFEGQPGQDQKCELIDGQQQLTTTEPSSRTLRCSGGRCRTERSYSDGREMFVPLISNGMMRRHGVVRHCLPRVGDTWRNQRVRGQRTV
jgi:hypothetical protein